MKIYYLETVQDGHGVRGTTLERLGRSVAYLESTLQRDGTTVRWTTIDGDAMLVYEVDADGAATDTRTDVTYDASADTAYLRRVEGDVGVLDSHWWGSVDPIEPPEMDCESY